MKNLTIDQVKFVNFEIGEIYQVTNNGKNYTIKVTDKKSGFESGKKSVITCTIDCDGQLITELINKDITIVKKHLNLTSDKSPRGTRKAEQHEKLSKLYNDFVALANEIDDYIIKEDAVEDVENVVTFVSAFEQVIKKAVTRLEATSKKAKEDQAEAMEYIRKMSPEQIAQFLQMQKG